MAKAPLVNPFAAAKKAVPAAAKPKTSVIVADAVLDPTGGQLYSQDDVVQAINNYCDGDSLVNQGDAMMKTSRPVVLAFGKQVFCREWAVTGKTPENPKITTDPRGTGRLIGISFNDREVNLKDEEFADMVALMGTDVAEASVTRRNEFKLKPDVLETEVEIKDAKGKLVKKQVMEHIADALQAKFADHPEILGNLFEMKEVFKTSKGLIHKGYQICQSMPAPAIGLQKYLDAIKTVIQLKPGKS